MKIKDRRGLRDRENVGLLYDGVFKQMAVKQG